MKEKFKAFLEQHFRNIAPTQAAMELRKSMLKQMLDREQELRIKGLDDDELILGMILQENKDIDAQLEEFEHQQIKSGAIKRKVSAISIVAVCVAVLLTLVYLLVGLFAHIWHPTWLIMVGGIFVGAITMLAFIGVKNGVKKRKYVIARLCAVVIEVLISVFVFLILQLVLKLPQAWLTFLAMVVMIFGVDTAIAFVVGSKIKWFELPVFVEILGVMLYVMLGITLGTIWHPGWVLCLVGVVCSIVEVVVFVIQKTHKDDKEEKAKINKKHVKIDEAYWTEWDD